jgi:UrcA family protein
MITKTPFRSFRGALAIAVLGVFACSLATVCTAAEPTDTQQTTVRYRDLNLSNPEGASALYARIQWAARQVCPTPDVRNLSDNEQVACVRKAIADAVAKVDEPALFIVYNAHNQTTPIVLAATQSR